MKHTVCCLLCSQDSKYFIDLLFLYCDMLNLICCVFYIQFRFVKSVAKVCWWMDPSFVINFNVWSCRQVVPRCMKRLQRRRRQLKRLTLKHMVTSGMKAMKSPMVTKIWLNGFKSRTRYAWDASDISILAKKAPTFKSWSF